MGGGGTDGGCLGCLPPYPVLSTGCGGGDGLSVIIVWQVVNVLTGVVTHNEREVMQFHVV